MEELASVAGKLEETLSWLSGKVRPLIERETDKEASAAIESALSEAVGGLKSLYIYFREEGRSNDA